MHKDEGKELEELLWDSELFDMSEDILENNSIMLELPIPYQALFQCTCIQLNPCVLECIGIKLSLIFTQIYSDKW